MFIIKKKRIYLMLIIITIFTISFGLNHQKENTLQTVSLPVTGKTIVLDAGHGFPDEGAFLLHKENKQLTFYK